MKQIDELVLIPEEPGIGLENESSFHSSIKKWYLVPGDRLEVKVDGFIIDIVRGDLLIEIQTRNFAAIKKKLLTLVKSHYVQLIYPVPKEKWITRLAASGDEVLSRRKSPKSGSVYDLFDELIRIPELINEEKFTVEVLMVRQEETRCEDGKGSWRRKGVSIKDKELIDVVERIKFNDKSDFLSLFPHDLSQPFSNKSLARTMGVPVRKVQKMTYCLRKMGAINEVGRKGNELLFII